MADVIGAAAFGVVVGMFAGCWLTYRWCRDELRAKTGIEMKFVRIEDDGELSQMRDPFDPGPR